MKSFALVVAIIVVASIVEMNDVVRSREAKKTEVAAVVAEVTDSIEEDLWNQARVANPPVPEEFKEDFIQLVRVLLTAEDLSVTQKACDEFRRTVFPDATDEQAYAWAFSLKGMDKITARYMSLTSLVGDW